MNNFVRRLALFLIPVVALIMCLEYTLYRLPNGYNTKKKLIEQQADSIQVLVLGSSHALRAVNPKYFTQRTLNMSYVSQSLYYDATLTYKYLPTLKRLKIVIIPISYFSLDYSLMDSPEHWRDYFYYQYYDILYPGISRTDIHLYSAISLYATPSLYTWLNENYKVNFKYELDRNGWAYTDTTRIELSNALGKLRVQKHLNTMHTFRRKENISILCGLIDTLRKKNIQVILMSTPLHSTYLKYTDSVYMRNLTHIIDSIVKSKNVKYFNFMTDGRFVDNDYVNCDHLNARGAKKFSTILDNEILRGSTLNINR